MRIQSVNVKTDQQSIPDAAADAIRITPNGTLASIDTTGAPSFELRLAACID